MNVAGTTYAGRLDANLEILDKEYLVNFRAVYSICQKICPHLIATKGWNFGYVYIISRMLTWRRF